MDKCKLGHFLTSGRLDLDWEQKSDWNRDTDSAFTFSFTSEGKYTGGIPCNSMLNETIDQTNEYSSPRGLLAYLLYWICFRLFQNTKAFRLFHIVFCDCFFSPSSARFEVFVAWTSGSRYKSATYWPFRSSKLPEHLIIVETQILLFCVTLNSKLG